MLLHQEESSRKLGNHLFDEGIAYCQKQQFEKAYQCFKRHLALNSFCQETFQMLSYCRYKFSENLRKNVSDLSIITKQSKSRECGSRKHDKASENIHNSSSAALQNFKSAKSNNCPGKFDFLSGHTKSRERPKLSETQQKFSSYFLNSSASNKNQRFHQSKSEPPTCFKVTKLHEVEKSVIVENSGKDYCSTDPSVKQMVDRQLKIELSLRNIDSSLSNVGLELNYLLTKEKKVNSDVLNLLRLVSHSSTVFESKTYQKQPVHLENIYLNNLAMSCRPQEFQADLANWSFPCGANDESQKSGYYGIAVYHYDVKSKFGKGICGQNTAHLVKDSHCFRQENEVENKLLSVQRISDLVFHVQSNRPEKLIGDVSSEQNFSTKRKLDFSNAYFYTSPQKKLQMSTLLNKATAKRKLDDVIKASDLKRQKIQSLNQCSGKVHLLKCGDTFKMLKELQLMRDLSVCDIDSGCRSVYLKTTFRRAQPACREMSLEKINRGFLIPRNAAVQMELPVSRNTEYLEAFGSNLRCSSGTVSPLHFNCILPENFQNQKLQVLISTTSARAPNCLNTFITQILCEIKDSLSFIIKDFVPMNSRSDSVSLSIRDVKLVLVPASGGCFTNYNILRFYDHGHYIEFPNMRVYQVDPFWAHHSTCDNSHVTCRDRSLCLNELQLQNRSPFVYPVYILLHSLSTDLYNLTLLVGPVRIRFVNFHSYYNATALSLCDN